MTKTVRAAFARAAEDLATAVWIACVLCWVLLLLIVQPARAADFPAVGSGTLLYTSPSGVYAATPPLSTDIQVSIAGVVARVAVVQTFANKGGEFSEAVYALPLPDDAAVDRLTMKVGDRVVEGEIHEREQAEHVYDAARAAGQHASLVRQNTPNLFTTAIANVAPGEAIEITIEYLQTARYDNGEFSLRVPMTYTERYGVDSQAQPAGFDALADGGLTRGANSAFAAGAVSSTVVGGRVAGARGAGFSAAAIFGGTTDTDNAAPSAPPLEASVHIALAPGFPLVDVATRGYDSRVAAGRDVYTLEPVTPQLPMDHDLVVAWRPVAGPTPTVAALSETVGDTTYAMLMLLPPQNTLGWRTQPRELICVVDTSGSMAGGSLAQAKTALANALGRLTSADRFNVIQFNSWTQQLYPESVPLTDATRGQALKWVEDLRANGGTEMEPALRAALEPPAPQGYLRQVIFLTDGGVADETRLFGIIKSDLHDARLFTVGIGSAPNSFFMRKAAQYGRGTFTYVGSTADVEDSMRELFEKLEHVALTDVLVDWPAAAELYPPQVPDLYSGEPLIVAGSFPAGDGKPVTLTAFGRVGGAPWQQAVTADTVSLHGISTLWARRKIETVLDSRVDGVSADVIRGIVLHVALEHKLVSPYTSFVAVDQEPARSSSLALERQSVASMRPAGQTAVAVPQTATPAPLLRVLGILLIAAAVLFWLGRRPQLAS
jgi:Ca-activated chloride channel family protein